MALVSRYLVTFAGKSPNCYLCPVSGDAMIGAITLETPRRPRQVQLSMRSSSFIVSAKSKEEEIFGSLDDEDVEEEEIKVDLPSVLDSFETFQMVDRHMHRYVFMPKQKLSAVIQGNVPRIMSGSRTDYESKLSSEHPKPDLEKIVDVTEVEIYDEYVNAIKHLGLEDKVQAFRADYLNAKSPAQLLLVMENIEDFVEKIEKVLPSVPNYEVMVSKESLLIELYLALDLEDKERRKKKLMKKVESKCLSALNKPELNKLVEELKAKMKASKASTLNDLKHSSKSVAKFKKGVALSLVEALKSWKVLSIEFINATAQSMAEKALTIQFLDDLEQVVEEIDTAKHGGDLKPSLELIRTNKLRGIVSDMYKKFPIEEPQKTSKKPVNGEWTNTKTPGRSGFLQVLDGVFGSSEPQQHLIDEFVNLIAKKSDRTPSKDD